jgi:hypothetical protein
LAPDWPVGLGGGGGGSHPQFTFLPSAAEAEEEGEKEEKKKVGEEEEMPESICQRGHPGPIYLPPPSHHLPISSREANNNNNIHRPTGQFPQCFCCQMVGKMATSTNGKWGKD